MWTLDHIHMSFQIWIANHIRSEMNKKALEAFRELMEDEELGSDDEQSVFQYITCLRTVEGVNVNEQHKLGSKDTRLLLLNGVQVAYWRMVGERKMTQTAFSLLMQSIDEAIDMVDSDNRLLDWQRLEAPVKFPHQFLCLQIEHLPQKLARLVTVAKLRVAYDICAAFIRAHRIARRQLRNFIGDVNVDEGVIQESEAEEKSATQFLQWVQRNYPQVLLEVRTESVAYSILLRISEYVQKVEKFGLLEAKEINQLHEAVEVDLKNLLGKGKEGFLKKFQAFSRLNYCSDNNTQFRESASLPLL